MKLNKKLFVGSWLVLGIVASESLALAAPSLTVGSVSAEKGSVVEVPINFDPGGAAISSLQFDLIMPSKVKTVAITPGKALSTAGANKSVSHQVKGQTLTCVIFGLNLDEIAASTVASIKLQIDAPAGTLKLPLSRVVFSDPHGKVIKSGKNVNGTLTVKAGNVKT